MPDTYVCEPEMKVAKALTPYVHLPSDLIAKTKK